jgi:hypothetical protein
MEGGILSIQHVWQFCHTRNSVVVVNFVTNRILFLSIWSPTISSISLVSCHFDGFKFKFKFKLICIYDNVICHFGQFSLSF